MADSKTRAWAAFMTWLIEAAINEVKNGNEKIHYAGEFEYLAQEIRSKEGIPMELLLLEQFDFLASKWGISPLTRSI